MPALNLTLDLSKLKSIKLTKEQQQGAVLAVVLVAGLGYAYWNYGVAPLARDAVRMEKELADKQENLKRARDMKRREVEYAERLQRVQIGQQFVARRLPVMRSPFEGIVRMNKTLQTKNMVLVSSVPDASPAASKSEFAGLDKDVNVVTVDGDFNSLGQFLSSLSAEDIVYYIEELQLAPADAARGPGKVRATLRLVSHTTLGTGK